VVELGSIACTHVLHAEFFSMSRTTGVRVPSSGMWPTACEMPVCTPREDMDRAPAAATGEVTRSGRRASSRASRAGGAALVLTAGLVLAASGYAADTRAAQVGTHVAPHSSMRAVQRPSGWLEGLQWVNHTPVRASDLEGKVTVVEFWTFGCVNCRRSIPGVKHLEADYAKADDVVLIGVHTPEFDFEKDRARVALVVREHGLEHPVAQDNDFKAWRAFKNRYWPAFYVLDRAGAVQYIHIGELHAGTPRYDALRQAIDAARREMR